MGIESDWIVHVDEDAFVFDAHRIDPLMAYMEENGYAACAMPDGGVIPHRFHNPVACNPFFMILNRRAILDRTGNNPPFTAQWDPAWENAVPDIARQGNVAFSFDAFEPYYGFFFWLLKNGLRILYLSAQQWSREPEGITTVLNDHLGEGFVLHTWYSRDYRVWRSSKYPLLRRVRRWLTGRPDVLRPGPHYRRIKAAMKWALRMREGNR